MQAKVVRNNGDISGSHKTQLYSDIIHAATVITVVICVTIVSLFSRIPNDVLGAVYGAAIAYAAGRAGPVHRTRADSE